MRAWLVVARNEMTQLYRDGWYLLLLTVGAVGALLIMAYTLSTDIENVTTLVVDLDNSGSSRQFIQALANDSFFALEFAAGRDQAEQSLRAGLAKVIVIFPPGYNQQLKRGEAAHIQVIIDGTEPGVAEFARNHVSALANDLSRQLMVKEMGRQGVLASPLLTFQPRVRYNANLKTIVSVMPGLMSIVLSVSAVGTASAFARERERGNFEMLICTPLGRWPLLLGRIFPYLFIGLFDIAIFTIIGYLAFEMPIQGNLGLFLLLSLIYIFATVSAGVLVAQFLHTQHAAMVVTFMLFGIAPTYLADIFFPVASMPVWLKHQSTLMPATHFTVIARGIFLKQVGWDVLWPNGLVLLIFGLVMSGLAYLRFQKKLG